jgi:hypothetical protein
MNHLNEEWRVQAKAHVVVQQWFSRVVGVPRQMKAWPHGALDQKRGHSVPSHTLVLGVWSFFGFWVLGFGDSIAAPARQKLSDLHFTKSENEHD